MIGGEGVPAPVLHGHTGSAAYGLEAHFDLGAIARCEAFLPPFDHQPLRRLPGEHTADFEGLSVAIDFQQAAGVKLQRAAATGTEQAGHFGLPPG